MKTKDNDVIFDELSDEDLFELQNKKTDDISNLLNAAKSTGNNEINNGSEITDHSEPEGDPEFSAPPNKKRKRGVFDYIRYFIMLIAGIIFLYSAFMLGKIFLEYKQGEDIYKSITNSVLTPIDDVTKGSSEDDEPLPFKYDHQALLNINPDGIGYLYIPSISVQLPIVQGTDNDYYLTHTFNRVYNGSGALFEDYRITGALTTTNIIIYGHNMKNGSMFAGLSKYLTPSFYKIAGNDVFYIYTENKLLEYKIYSAYISEPISDTYTFNFTTTAALREYARTTKELSCFNTGVDVSTATQVVTFSTCTGDGSQRIIVHGTLVGETPLQ